MAKKKNLNPNTNGCNKNKSTLRIRLTNPALPKRNSKNSTCTTVHRPKKICKLKFLDINKAASRNQRKLSSPRKDNINNSTDTAVQPDAETQRSNVTDNIESQERNQDNDFGLTTPIINSTLDPVLPNPFLRHPPLGFSEMIETVVYKSLGPMNSQCTKCSAILWDEVIY